MKKLIIVLLTLIPILGFSQTEFTGIFTGKCNIQQTGSGSGYWTVGITGFNNPRGFDCTEITVGDKIYFNDGGISFELPITVIVSAVGNTATVRVDNTGITSIGSVPTTAAILSRATSNFNLPPWAANTSGNDNQMVNEYMVYLIDSLIGLPSIDTIYGNDGSVIVDGDTIIQKTNVYHNWYIHPNGVNATAVEGDIFKPAFSPFYLSYYKSHKEDIFNITRGTYTAGVDPTFGTSSPRRYGLVGNDSLIVNCDRGTVFTAANNFSTAVPWITDYGVGFAVDSARVFTMTGFPTFRASNSVNSIKAPIAVYHASSVLNLDIGRIELLGGGRNWACQTACKKVKLNVDEIEISGGIVYSVQGTNNKQINARFGTIITDGVTDAFGALRCQYAGIDSTSSVRFDVNYFWNRGANGRVCLFDQAGSMYNSNTVVNCTKMLQSFKAGKIDGYTTGAANTTSGAVLFGGNTTMAGSKLTVNVGDITTPNAATVSFSSAPLTLDSSVIELNIGKGYFSQTAPFLVEGFVLRNNSKLVINCQDCRCTGTQSAFWVFNNTTDATSSIEIRGKYTVNGARAVLNTRNEVVLNNATLVNDGSVAAVQSDAATNVIVLSAYANATATDSDITELVGTITKNANVK